MRRHRAGVRQAVSGTQRVQHNHAVFIHSLNAQFASQQDDVKIAPDFRQFLRRRWLRLLCGCWMTTRAVRQLIDDLDVFVGSHPLWLLGTYTEKYWETSAGIEAQPTPRIYPWLSSSDQQLSVVLA
jgi:hypothetical protein